MEDLIGIDSKVDLYFETIEYSAYEKFREKRPQPVFQKG